MSYRVGDEARRIAMELGYSARLEPVGVEVEEGDDEDGEK